MGYCISQRRAQFKMDPKDFPAALKAIQALRWKETPVGYNVQHFAWISPNFHEIQDFVEMLREWRWDLAMDITNNVLGIHFVGEKMGADELLFDTIAPWVEKGSYIEMQGEDGNIWRWVFDGKHCHEKYAKLSFD